MKKVVLIFQQGSGNNLLRAFLNSHPDIEFYEEILLRKPEGMERATEKKILDKIYGTDKKVVGFALAYHPVMKSGAINYLKDNDISVIHLIRDPVRTAVKKLLQPISSQAKMTEKEMGEYCEEVLADIKRTRNLFGDGDYLEIYYEDMTRGRFNITELPEDFEKKILEWLGVKYKKLSLDKKHCPIELKMRYI